MQKGQTGVQGRGARRLVWEHRGQIPEYFGLVSQAKGLGSTPWATGNYRRGFGRGVTWSDSPVRIISPVEKCGCIVWRRESLTQQESDRVKCRGQCC